MSKGFKKHNLGFCNTAMQCRGPGSIVLGKNLVGSLGKNEKKAKKKKKKAGWEVLIGRCALANNCRFVEASTGEGREASLEGNASRRALRATPRNYKAM